jgi:hypothetical protein
MLLKQRFIEVVTPGFMPGIHVLPFLRKEDVDGRDKLGHDGKHRCGGSTKN